MSEKPKDWEEMWRRLKWNDNLHPDILKLIKNIKPANLLEGWIIEGDLFSCESQSELLDKLKNNWPTHSPGRKIINQ